MSPIRSKSPRRRKDNSEGIDRIIEYLKLATKGVEWQENQAEQRVKLFLTIAAGSIAFLTLILNFGVADASNRQWISLAVLCVLLAYGIETLHSLNWMIIHRREAQAVDGYLRSKLASLDSTASRMNEIRLESDAMKVAHAHNHVRGSRQEFMYLTNCLLTGGITFNLASSFGCNIVITWVMISAVVVATLFLQCALSR